MGFCLVLSGNDFDFAFAVRFYVTASKLSGREAWGVAWFGPKGFASVVYGILILQGGFGHLAHLVGLSVAASIVCLFVRRHICRTVV